MPKGTCVCCEALATTRGMHITPQQRNIQLARQRRHVFRIEIGIGTKVMVHMDREGTAAR